MITSSRSLAKSSPEDRFQRQGVHHAGWSFERRKGRLEQSAGKTINTSPEFLCQMFDFENVRLVNQSKLPWLWLRSTWLRSYLREYQLSNRDGRHNSARLPLPPEPSETRSSSKMPSIVMCVPSLSLSSPSAGARTRTHNNQRAGDPEAPSSKRTGFCNIS